MTSKDSLIRCSPSADLSLSLRPARRREVSCAVSSVPCFSSCSPLAQNQSVAPSAPGSFYVEGIVYQYVTGTDFTVVAAAHSVLNHKFLAVKLRIYNVGPQSVTVKPEDVVLQDANGDRALAAVSGAELAKKMRHPYNWSRYAVTPMTGGGPQPPEDSATITPQLVEMMKAMAARSQGVSTAMMPGGKNLLYTDTPGALRSPEATPDVNVCDQICQLHNVEANSPDVLTQLQRQNDPDYVQQNAFLANTITPRANAVGIFYCPLGKLSESSPASAHSRKSRLLRVTVPVGSESFEFIMPVE